MPSSSSSSFSFSYQHPANIFTVYHPHRGTLLVAQFVEALHYKPEGRRFVS
jgi:hypothetical protein